MSHTNDWAIRGNYHKQKAQEHKDNFNTLLRRCFRDPSLRPKADAEWAEYERHRDRAEHCFKQAWGKPA